MKTFICVLGLALGCLSQIAPSRPFELPCPAGYSPLPQGVTFDPLTQSNRANICVRELDGTWYENYPSSPGPAQTGNGLVTPYVPQQAASTVAGNPTNSYAYQYNTIEQFSILGVIAHTDASPIVTYTHGPKPPLIAGNYNAVTATCTNAGDEVLFYRISGMGANTGYIGTVNCTTTSPYTATIEDIGQTGDGNAASLYNTTGVLTTLDEAATSIHFGRNVSTGDPQVSSFDGIVIGMNYYVSGEQNLVVGIWDGAPRPIVGNANTLVGSGSLVASNGNTVVGSGSSALYGFGTCVGLSCIIDSEYGVSMGDGATAQGTGSVALGSFAEAYGTTNSSVAIGYYAGGDVTKSYISIGGEAYANESGDAIIGGPLTPISLMVVGSGEYSSANMLNFPEVITTTASNAANQGGATLTLRGGNGTGTQGSGPVNIEVGVPGGASGTTPSALSDFVFDTQGGLRMPNATGTSAELATGTSNATDLAGVITIAGTPPTGSHNFTHIYTVNPICLAESFPSATLAAITISTSTLDITGATGDTSAEYICIGRN